MNILSIILICIGIIFIILAIQYYYKAKNMIDTKNYHLQQEQEKKDKLTSEIKILENSKNKLQENLIKEEQLNQERIKNLKQQAEEQVSYQKLIIKNAGEQYTERLEESYNQAEKQYQQKKQNLQLQQKQIEKDIEDAGARLEDLKTQINAATEASLREREKEENLNFYKLSISPLDLEDIEKLESVKLMLHNPTILSKLIWSTYFQKQTTELCNRVLGANTVSGIYKITDLKTKQCYIGQATDTAKRWKEHVKCGLGIDAPATNKLYNTMQRDKVWNFTFELLEKCPKDKLDEAEKRWIEIYQSNKIGLNITKGGSGK